MKKKYLAYCLALSMALTAVAPVAAAEPVDIVVEDDSEDTAVDFAEDNEEADVAEEDTEDVEDTADDVVETADFNDGEEAAPAVGDTTEDGWVKMSTYKPDSYADSTMEAKYDEQTQTLYLRVSQPEEMKDLGNSIGAPWYEYLKEKDAVTEVKKVVIGEGITRVGNKNFNTLERVSGTDFFDSLEEVVLPSTVTEIGTQAFASDKSLKKINLENVSKIGQGAFTNTALESVTFNTDEVTLEGNVFAGSSITSFRAKKVKLTGNDTFYNCKFLNSFEVESGLEEIPEETFKECGALSSFDFSKVKNIGKYAFDSCKLEKVEFGEAEVTLGSSAFSSNENLVSVKGHGLTLSRSTFSYCTALSEFITYVPIESIPVRAFRNTGLTSFDFSKVKNIASNGFANSKLEKIEFGETELTINSSAFSGCESLTAVCYPGTEEKWKEISASVKSLDTATTHCKADTVEAKAATCTETGLKEVGVCEVCGMHYSYETEENVIPALGHDYEAEFTVDKAATCTETGVKSRHCTRCDAKTDEQAIPAAGHKWSAWKKTADATVNAPEQQVRKCSVCGKEETQAAGAKLAPKMTVNAATVTLKVKQSTSGLKVTGLAKGDSVKSWKSSNRKVFTVSGKANGTCKITGKKKGTAKLEITLASGLKKTVKVKVQKTAVKTTKISGLKKNVSLKKGKKTTLKPVIAPFTSREKVTYRSSNKKVATVSSKGVVTAKKKGTAKITVRSGKKSYTVKIKVR